MKKILIMAACSAIAVGVLAETKPFQASLTPDIAIQSKDTRIDGVALSIWGENPQSAFALGFVNGSTGDSKGFSLGLLNYSEDYTGVQWGIVNYSTGEFTGWQNGFVNYAENMTGLQSAFVNYAEQVKGVQFGAVNVAMQMTGLQFGWVNYAEKVDSGVQIGLVNIIKQNEWFTNFPDELAKGMVILNWRFN
ncbi:LA_2272 family surface repeat-containing protein [Pontiella sulfatireligans]|uniref:Uncharacterized protein n=1 Tax=Pontiella sulfatireligans TaxID=2750658 RepID=A0A6C2UTK3_9BACT|nr:hypothetical protein [Pontiella sulfatireligans]VGO22547.1 hypothetical protein SCARR_04631 [Pontiella sulfatireligans]